MVCSPIRLIQTWWRATLTGGRGSGARLRLDGQWRAHLGGYGGVGGCGDVWGGRR